MDKVDNLAEYLVELRHEASLTLSNQQASTTISLWQDLLSYDKQRVLLAARHQERLNLGRYRTSQKKEFTPGVDSMKRCVLSSSGSPAQRPDCCRLVEAMCVRLSNIHKSPKKGRSRWDLIVDDFTRIQQLIIGNATVIEHTNMQLVPINARTVQQWYSQRLKRQHERLLLQGLDLPPSRPVACEPLPSASLRPVIPSSTPGVQVKYHLPSSTVGQANAKRRAEEEALPPSRPRQILPRAVPLPAAASIPLVHHLSTTHSTQTAPLFFSQVTRPPTYIPQTPMGTVFIPTAAPPPQPTPGPQKRPSKARFNKRTVDSNSCRKCGQFRTIDTGHSQYKGYIYCPNTESLPKEEWLKQTKQKLKQ